MKKLRALVSIIALCAGIVMSLAACSDNKQEPETPAAKSIEGVYNGDVDCIVLGEPFPLQNASCTFTITANDDTSVKIVISPFGDPPMRISELLVPAVKVSGSEGVYSLAETVYNGETGDGKTYKITLAGGVGDNTLTVRFELYYGAMPMPMNCTFTARKE